MLEIAIWHIHVWYTFLKDTLPHSTQILALTTSSMGLPGTFTDAKDAHVSAMTVDNWRAAGSASDALRWCPKNGHTWASVFPRWTWIVQAVSVGTLRFPYDFCDILQRYSWPSWPLCSFFIMFKASNSQQLLLDIRRLVTEISSARLADWRMSDQWWLGMTNVAIRGWRWGSMGINGDDDAGARSGLQLQRVTLFGRWPHPSSFQGRAGVGGSVRPHINKIQQMIQVGRWAQCHFMILHQVLISFNNMEQRTFGQCGRWISWHLLKTEWFPSLPFTARVNAQNLAQPATMVILGLSVTTTLGCCWARSRSDDTARLRHVFMVSFRPETSINQEIEMMKTLSSLPQILGMTTKTILYYALPWYDVICYDMIWCDGFWWACATAVFVGRFKQPCWGLNHHC